MSHGQEIEPDELLKWIGLGKVEYLVDVRSEEELEVGLIQTSCKSVHVPLSDLHTSQVFPEAGLGKIVFYCASGLRSSYAARKLRNEGKSSFYSLSGGFERWKREARPIAVSCDELSQEARERFHRQLILSEVGVSGQKTLLDSKVLVVGAGGLGSPCSIYLAASGVGAIGLIDGDRVELSNLQRQILHTTADIGNLKVESGERKLKSIHPSVQVQTYPFNLDETRAVEICKNYDVIVDGSDNFTTRYLLNEVCVLLKKPLVYGAVFRFQGQIMSFLPGGPCYRCLFSEAPTNELAPSCSEAGVLGVIPGIIGVHQALETLKILLNIGIHKSVLMNYDAIEGNWQKFSVRVNPDCMTCQKKGAL